MNRSAFSLLVVAALAGCSSEGASGPQTVYAFRVTSADQLIGGRTARGAIGDYKIHNARVAFIIQDVGLASGYQRYGGLPIDVPDPLPSPPSGLTPPGLRLVPGHFLT